MQVDTITCADCFDLMATLEDGSIDAIISDLPYGSTACHWDTRVDLDAWWAAVKRVLKPRGVFVTTASQPFTSVLVCSNLAWFREEWIWHKSSATRFMDAKIRPLKAHENILVFGEKLPCYNPQYETGEPYSIERKGGLRYVWDKDFVRTSTVNDGFRYPQTVIYVPVENGLHPTQKPQELFAYLVRTYTQPGNVVLDPFAGSGTTALACLKTGRHYICGDSDPDYVAIANRRLAIADPYCSTPVSETEVQLSLFEERHE